MEIIDAVIKISIGAIFGGLVIFFSLKEKLQKADHAQALRRVTILEEVAQHTGKVSHVFSKYSSLTSEISINPERMTSKQQQELNALSNELVEVYEEVSIADSKLLLLGEKRLGKAMKLYTGSMAQYLKKFNPSRNLVKDDISKAKQEISQMREQFYDILSERYDQIMR